VVLPIEGIEIQSWTLLEIWRINNEKGTTGVKTLYEMDSIFAGHADSFTILRDFLASLPERNLIESGIDLPSA